MSKPYVLLATAALTALASLPAGAQALNVRPGLWQTTMQQHFNGQFPGMSDADIAKMPPEAQARMRAAMQASTAEMSKPHSAKYCLTAAEIAKGFGGDVGQHPGMNCTRNLAASSPTSQTVQVSCKSDGGDSTTGTFQINAMSPTTVSGVFDMNIVAHGKSMKMHSTMTSQWLAADCGTIKPGEPVMQ